jgi:hypothetical protein
MPMTDLMIYFILYLFFHTNLYYFTLKTPPFYAFHYALHIGIFNLFKIQMALLVERGKQFILYSVIIFQIVCLVIILIEYLVSAI